MFLRIVKTVLLIAVVGYVIHARSCGQLAPTGLQDVFRRPAPTASVQMPDHPQQTVNAASNTLLDTFNDALRQMKDYQPGQHAEGGSREPQVYDNARNIEDYYRDMNRRTEDSNTYEEAVQDIKRQ